MPASIQTISHNIKFIDFILWYYIRSVLWQYKTAPSLASGEEKYSVTPCVCHSVLINHMYYSALHLLMNGTGIYYKFTIGFRTNTREHREHRVNKQ